VLSFLQDVRIFPHQMSWFGLLIILLAGAAVMFVLEQLGMPTTLNLSMKGDLKRESRWLAQYGQFACTPVAGILAWQLDEKNGQTALLLIAVAVAANALVATLIKRLLGRVRPGRENAGKFLGPSFKHANYRESFPSSHSASAAALSGVLAIMYPQAFWTFWALAIICAVLRWLLDAHWPSDVLAGLALGLGVAHLTWYYVVPK
jgi:undecaprenyl-diphosphatase